MANLQPLSLEFNSGLQPYGVIKLLKCERPNNHKTFEFWGNEETVGETEIGRILIFGVNSTAEIYKYAGEC